MTSINTPGPKSDEEIVKTYDIQIRKDYGAVYKISRVAIPCYSKKQMRRLYSDCKFELEYAPGSSPEGQVGILRYGKTELPLKHYGTSSRATYSEKALVAVDNGKDSFVVMLRNVLLQRCLLSLLCLLVLAGVIAVIVNQGKGTPVSTGAMVPDLEPGVSDWEEMKPTGTSSFLADGIRIPGYKSISIEADTTEVSVNLYNPEKNNCYFVIRLVLLDPKETLYESKMIEPGKGLNHIVLSRALRSGTYSAQLQYEPYDMVTLTRLNGAVLNIDLIVE